MLKIRYHYNNHRRDLDDELIELKDDSSKTREIAELRRISLIPFSGQNVKLYMESAFRWLGGDLIW